MSKEEEKGTIEVDYALWKRNQFRGKVCIGLGYLSLALFVATYCMNTRTVYIDKVITKIEYREPIQPKIRKVAVIKAFDRLMLWQTNYNELDQQHFYGVYQNVGEGTNYDYTLRELQIAQRKLNLYNKTERLGIGESLYKE